MITTSWLICRYPKLAMPCPSQSACPTPSQSFSRSFRQTGRQTDTILSLVQEYAIWPYLCYPTNRSSKCQDVWAPCHVNFPFWVPLPQQTDSLSGLKLVLLSSIQPVRSLSPVSAIPELILTVGHQRSSATFRFRFVKFDSLKLMQKTIGQVSIMVSRSRLMEAQERVSQIH